MGRCGAKLGTEVGAITDRLFTFLRAMRKLVATRACAVEPSVKPEDGTHRLASSAMLIMGPVSHIKMLEEEGGVVWTHLSATRGGGVPPSGPAEDVWEAMKYNLECEPFRGNEGGDESRGWPMIASVKQKKAMTAVPQTKKMIVFSWGPKKLNARPTK